MDDKNRIQILYTKQCERFVKPVSDAVAQFFGLRSFQNKNLSLIAPAYNTSRKQYDASSLLEYMSRSKNEPLAIWLVDQDIYAGEKQYAFGFAARNYGGIVSTFRLKSDESVLKEALHRVGHMMGLKHCNNRCFMRQSNTPEEVASKPYRMCDTCKSTLHFHIKSI